MNNTPTKTRNCVCISEIRCEMFGESKDVKDRNRSLYYSDLMSQIDGWVRSGKSVRVPIYGKQRVFCRA